MPCFLVQKQATVIKAAQEKDLSYRYWSEVRVT